MHKSNFYCVQDFITMNNYIENFLNVVAYHIYFK